jgi:hypothetical protein
MTTTITRSQVDRTGTFDYSEVMASDTLTERGFAMTETTVTPTPSGFGEATSTNGQADDQGKPDVSQCDFKTPKGRQCKLAPGHEGPHRMVLRDQVPTPPTVAELKAKGVKINLKMDAVPKSANIGREYKREAAPRDADQLKVDGDVRKAYEEWKAAGKPKVKLANGKPNPAVPWKRYIIPPVAFDTVIALLRRATSGSGPVGRVSLKYNRHNHESGDLMIYFAVMDYDPKEETTT